MYPPPPPPPSQWIMFFMFVFLQWLQRLQWLFYDGFHEQLLVIFIEEILLYLELHVQNT